MLQGNHNYVGLKFTVYFKNYELKLTINPVSIRQLPDQMGFIFGMKLPGQAWWILIKNQFSPISSFGNWFL